MRTKVGRAGALIGALFFLVFGAWAFIDPGSFYDRVATWPPYNEHLIHDVSAFQSGLGIGLAAMLAGMVGTRAVLAGAAGAAVLHVVSHVIDYGDGGRSTDPYLLAVVALALVIAFAAESIRR
jgi:hypothetical protein